MDSEDPTGELERTEFVRVGTQHALLRRIVEAAEIDTVVDTRLVVDSITTSPRKAPREQRDRDDEHPRRLQRPGLDRAQVRVQVLRPLLRRRAGRPRLLHRVDGPPAPPRTPIERDIVEAEAAVADFAEKNPDVDGERSCASRTCSAPTCAPRTPTLFSLPAVPTILGFDPRYQFVHEDDVVAALAHAVTCDVPGIYNVAGDGVLALTEVIDLLGKQYAPILPPWGTGLAARAAAPRRACASPPRCSASCASAAASTTAS